MNTKERKIFDDVATVFKNIGFQVITVDNPASKVYSLKTRKFNSVETIDRELIDLVDLMVDPCLVYLYEVLSFPEINNSIIEMKYAIRMDIQ